MRIPSVTNEAEQQAQVRDYWTRRPLGSLESTAPPGSAEFFAWHDHVRDQDVEAFAMSLYGFDEARGQRVLDVGCGIGWLCRHFAAAGAEVTGVDLASTGVMLTQRRLALGGLVGKVVQGDAEQLPFKSASFDLVTCAGVLHHTTEPARGIAEIHRVLRPGGRAVVSLYYRNWLLSRFMWPLTRQLLRVLGTRVPGRSRLPHARTVEELVRAYDGDENPIGKAYTRAEANSLVGRFAVDCMEVHYFPVRFVRFGRLLPQWLRRWLDRWCGLLLYLRLRRPDWAGEGTSARSADV